MPAIWIVCAVELCSCVARKNAFEVMMMSQKSLARKSELPVRIEDRMFNDLVDLSEEKRWKWSDGGDTHGSNQST